MIMKQLKKFKSILCCVIYITTLRVISIRISRSLRTVYGYNWTLQVGLGNSFGFLANPWVGSVFGYECVELTGGFWSRVDTYR